MTPLRVTLRRTVFLLAGGAVAIAFFILASSVYAPLQDAGESGRVFFALWICLVAAAGMLPGVRELEVAGARDLLRVPEGSVVVPTRAVWAHRWRTALWTLLHQLVGALVGLALTLTALALGGLCLYAAGRRTFAVPGAFSWTVPDGAGGAVSVLGGTVLLVAAALLLTALAGRGAAWAAPVLLGPTGTDRLRLAEERLARGQGHLRLSQDLHDGVGHSLSAISLQAVAAERAAARGQDVSAPLRTIHELAAGAVDELEHALTVLRDEADGRVRLAEQRDLRDLPELVADHRRRGMTLEGDWSVGSSPPSVVGRIAHRVVAEGLANAAKHAPGSPVRLEVTHAEDLVVSVRNPVREGHRPGAAGHGLTGVREQVELVGGRLHVGPGTDGTWLLEARLPGGGRRGR